MNVTRTYKYLAGALLLSTAVSSFAVALGPLRATSIVGRPFEATVAAQMNESENLPALCVESTVSFGDSPVAPNRVRTTVAAGPNPGEVLIKIQVTALIDEPLVTVSLSEGCLQKKTRQYIVLAEVLSGSKLLSPQAGLGDTGSTPTSVRSTTDLTQPASAWAGVATPGVAETGSVAKSVKAARSPRPAAVRTTPATPTTTRAPSPAAESPKGALLQTKPDPARPAAQRDPAVRSAAELLSRPTSALPQSASPTSALQAVSVQPQEVLQNNEGLKAVAVDVPRAPSEGRKTAVAVEQLQGELVQARGERYSNWLVYALGTAVALLLLLVFFYGTTDASPKRRKTSGATT